MAELPILRSGRCTVCDHRTVFLVRNRASNAMRGEGRCLRCDSRSRNRHVAQHACAAVGLDRLLDRLPAGLDTPCHERGVSLSAGERQLLALARAFLSQPRLLVLDEATSSLDLRTEAAVESALDVVLEGRTAVIIAHRLQTTMRADRIVVVDDGGIAEVGTRDELLALGGRFADMNATASV